MEMSMWPLNIEKIKETINLMNSLPKHDLTFYDWKLENVTLSATRCLIRRRVEDEVIYSSPLTVKMDLMLTNLLNEEGYSTSTLDNLLINDMKEFITRRHLYADLNEAEENARNNYRLLIEELLMFYNAKISEDGKITTDNAWLREHRQLGGYYG